MVDRPKLPMGSMKVSKAKQRWEDVRKAAQSGDPAAMMDAVSRFQGIANTMLVYFANRDRLRAERDEAKAEIERMQDLMSLAHASMRACGWHLALGDDMAGDGVLQAAVVEIEEKYRQALKGTSNDQ